MSTTGTNSIAVHASPGLPADHLGVRTDRPVQRAQRTSSDRDDRGGGRRGRRGDFSQAQCFTSLDGASFLDHAGELPRRDALVNGWTNAPFSTNKAAVANINGVVTFKGAIASGTAAAAFTLPVAYRPATDVYVKVDMCNATEGRLYIAPSGLVQVESQSSFTNATCFTSLDGASFVQSGSFQTPLTLQNGWVGAPFSTAAPAVEDLAGEDHLSGAIGTAGTNPDPFVLPHTAVRAGQPGVRADLAVQRQHRPARHFPGWNRHRAGSGPELRPGPVLHLARQCHLRQVGNLR